MVDPPTNNASDCRCLGLPFGRSLPSSYCWSSGVVLTSRRLDEGMEDSECHNQSWSKLINVASNVFNILQTSSNPKFENAMLSTYSLRRCSTLSTSLGWEISASKWRRRVILHAGSTSKTTRFLKAQGGVTLWTCPVHQGSRFYAEQMFIIVCIGICWIWPCIGVNIIDKLLNQVHVYTWLVGHRNCTIAGLAFGSQASPAGHDEGDHERLCLSFWHQMFLFL